MEEENETGRQKESIYDDAVGKHCYNDLFYDYINIFFKMVDNIIFSFVCK